MSDGEELGDGALVGCTVSVALGETEAMGVGRCFAADPQAAADVRRVNPTARASSTRLIREPLTLGSIDNSRALLPTFAPRFPPLP